MLDEFIFIPVPGFNCLTLVNYQNLRTEPGTTTAAHATWDCACTLTIQKYCETSPTNSKPSAQYTAMGFVLVLHNEMPFVRNLQLQICGTCKNQKGGCSIPPTPRYQMRRGALVDLCRVLLCFHVLCVARLPSGLEHHPCVLARAVLLGQAVAT